jgi:Tfp pilus assembly protein PilE
MKSYKKQNFTLIEIMFVVGILVILIGISWVAGNKILRKSAENQTKAEVTMIHKACEAYNVRFDGLPSTSDTTVNFINYLSKVRPGSTTYSGTKRPMFVDFRKSNINLDNDSYDAISGGATIASDPYDQEYKYVYNSGAFYIYSAGVDGQSTAPHDDKTLANNVDNIVSTKLNE